MQPKKPSVLRTISKVLLFLLLLSLPFVFWLNRFSIYDWWRLRTYTPPAEIVAIADHTTMQPRAKRIFYAHHPEFKDSSELRDSCQQDQISIVLGCYIAGQGIYLYNVNDPRLSGVKEVTGAHEMLHAAYDRLSSSEKTRVNGLLDKAFAQVKDERVIATIEQYRQKDPNIVHNELHSILGSEVRELPPELEEYYKQYFSDRGAVVAYSEKYEGEFSSRQAKVKVYDEQLASLRKQIDDNQQKLDSQSTALKQEKARLDALLAASDYESYNQGVGSFNQRVNSYNSLADSTTTLIERYNVVVADRNAAAVEINDLAKAIDTRPQGISN